MSRRLALAVATFCLLTLLAPCVWASEAEEQAQKAFDAIYGADVKQVLSSRDTTKAVELAAKLLESAKAAEGQPELMSLLCTRACELGAMDPKGYETAQAAADLVASKAPDAAGPCQEALAAIRQRQYDAARGDAKTQAGEALVDALLALAATRTRTGKVEDAGKPLYKALAVAKAINSSKIETVDALLKAHADRQKNVALLAQLKKQVEADPANAKARDPLVTLLVVGFDNPAEAAKYLVDACDSALKKFVPAAARPVADAPEMACLELADWYMQLAATAGPASKLAMYVRAVQYGERFLELHTAKDLDRTRVELAVKKAGDEITRLGGAASDKGHWMDVLKLVDPARDTIRGQWEQTKAGLLTDAGSPHAVIGVPIEPSGNYELEVKFVRLAGSADVGVSFPAGPNHAVLCLAWRGGTTSGLSGINETLVNPSGLSNNHVYTVVLRVMTAEDKAQITATLDGKPLVKWEGPQKALSVPFFVALRNPKCVGLSAYKSRVLFQSVRLKMLSGKAVPTRPMGAAKSDTKPTEK